MKSFFSLVAMLLILAISTRSFAVPHLSSYPSARAVIFLDFDGHTVSNTIWNKGDAIECLPALLTDKQITEIFNRVAEDYRPFNLNVTTDSSIFLNAPLVQRTRVIITPTNYWRRGPGGIAYIGSFTIGEEIPCFVFTTIVGEQNFKALAEVISHESGHTLGLQHQSTYDESCNLTNVYNMGTGIGETAWAPIMGTGNERNFSLWNYGPTQKGCSQKQDNLYFITQLNGFDYRHDDHGNDIGHATSISAVSTQQFSHAGIITTIQDVDVFQFNFAENGNFKLNAIPFSVGTNNEGANLDIAISLLNAAGDTIAVYNPGTQLDAEIDTVLQSGIYYIAIDGTGNTNTLNDYGSLGSYSLNGEFSPNSSILPLRRIILKGFIDKNKPFIKWQIDPDDLINTITLEKSADKITYTPIYHSTMDKLLIELPHGERTDQYFRLKVTTRSGETKYSEIIMFEKEMLVDPVFRVKSISPHELIITTDKNYNYRVFDSNGSLLSQGKGSAGTSRINLSAWHRGIYWVQLLNGMRSSTQKILKY